MATASEIVVTLSGGRRVDAQVGRHLVRTDQSIEDGGEDSAASPFQLFLASIGTCAGVFVQGFCAKRNISYEGIRIRQRPRLHPETGVLVAVDLDIEIPPGFPEKYREALVRVADKCSVKQSIQAQPTFAVRVVPAGT
jgi:ribosomal protein S12 methylthiotransferase accessory factor